MIVNRRLSTILAVAVLALIVGYSAWDYFRTPEIKFIGPYEMDLPKGFRIEESQGIQSYVGKITDDTVVVYFDYGLYSDPLLLSHEKFALTAAQIPDEQLIDAWSPGEDEEIRSLTKKVLYDSITDQWKIHYRLNDSLMIALPVVFPEEYARYEFIGEDSTISDYRKLLLPKDPKRDYTGFYIRELYCAELECKGLSMVAHGLNAQQHKKIVRMFTSIRRRK